MKSNEGSQRERVEHSLRLLESVLSELNLEKHQCESCKLQVFDDWPEALTGKQIGAACSKLFQTLQRSFPDELNAAS
jgi:hypothetical protein